jgi:hypothetical protein
MTVLDQVKELITARAPEALCDDCIADKLNLSVRQHANHKTRELGKLRGFKRQIATCGSCGGEKLVIWKVEGPTRKDTP